MTYEWISLKGQGAMSSSAGNTIGPKEALELVPPEILRYLIASNKPKKAIDFDTGMSLVELADEYERLVVRDLEAEAASEGLSRRQKVAIEDALGAMRMSRIGNVAPSPITFRHLAMLAQVKSDDAIITMHGDGIKTRLMRMHNWINGPHFPQEMKISVLEEVANGLDLEITTALATTLASCEWNVKEIGSAITSAFNDNDIPMKEGYRTLYLSILGSEKGPRLAPILVELERGRVLTLLGN
jgi:lysyl-tRNA synthetase class 1